MSTSITQSFGPTEIFLRTLVAGGVAGCCAKSTVAPFDRVKILLQGHHHHYRHLGVLSTFGAVFTKEGIPGLYRGNLVQMLRIFPYAATQFACYEQSRKYLISIFGEKHWTHLIAGSFAGMTAVAFTYPLDIIRTRLAFQVAAPSLSLSSTTGISYTARRLVSSEGGVKALYRGLVPTMIGMAPYAGISFYSYAAIKDFMRRYGGRYFTVCSACSNRSLPASSASSCTTATTTSATSASSSPVTTTTTTVHRHEDDIRLTVTAKLLCGGLAGAFAQTIAYPLDVTRRRMQLHIMLPENQRFSTWYHTLHRLALDHGVRQGLYRGISLNYLKVTPTVAVSFSVYELMRDSLGLA